MSLVRKFLSSRVRKLKIRDLIFCIISAILLILSFPNYNLWVFAWVGFVPLFFALENKSKRKAFLLSYFTGVVFWFGIVYWLVHVTLAGLIVLALYLALYFGIFGLIFSTINYELSTMNYLSIPSFWVILEYLRSHLFTGFPWALLGYAQYLNLPVIQIADIAGVWGVSWLVMMVNVAIYSVVSRKSSVVSKKQKLILPILCMFVSLVYGYYKIYHLPLTNYHLPLKISVIQGNIPQELKWDPLARQPIMNKYLEITAQAAKDKPDLIIWPEAALPCVLEEEPIYSELVRSFVKEIHAPLLLGAVRRQNEIYYNSAILISAEGNLLNIYDKLHLVPFGEYIPLRKIFPFLETVVPIGDFTPGTEYTVFTSHEPRATSHEVRFSVLICFEDLFPELSREFVRRGARFLVNITNDAWFGQTSSPYQHFCASVLRAVENRVPVVRAANTGVSGFIASSGKIISKVGDKRGREIFIEGYETKEIKFPKKSLSFYSRFGDIFIFVCILLIFYVIIALLKKKQ